MANNIKWDTSDFDKKITTAVTKAESVMAMGVRQIADEILRLSQFEVPHDTGLLQNSGHVENGLGDEQIVGYNKVYAARLHEHPEYRFQGGRKGKYLEDPIKNNLMVFKKYIEEMVRGAF